MEDIEHKLLEQTLKNDINILSIKVDNNYEKLNSKIDDVVSPMVNNFFSKHEDLKEKVNTLDEKISNLDQKAVAKEADQMKNIKRWIIGLIGTGVGGYVLMNIDKILKSIFGGA